LKGEKWNNVKKKGCQNMNAIISFWIGIVIGALGMFFWKSKGYKN
jgi:hypothetical protein